MHSREVVWSGAKPFCMLGGVKYAMVAATASASFVMRRLVLNSRLLYVHWGSGGISFTSCSLRVTRPSAPLPSPPPPEHDASV